MERIDGACPVNDRYVALLRGINVGKAKRIAMADLRALVESLGYHDVQTLLNSGNIVFASTAAKARNATGRISAALTEALGVSARVTTLSAQEIGEIVDENPLLPVMTDPSRMMVSVLADAAYRVQLEPLTQAAWGDERIALGTRVAYVWCANGLLESAIFKQLDRTLRDAVTTRNWATMLKLHALVVAT